MKTTKEMEKWFEDRKKTFIVFCIISAVIGCEYSIVVPTLYSYLENELRTEYANIWFGFIISSYYISSLIGSVTITRCVDNSKQIRLTLLVVCVTSMFGNLLYALPVSVFFPLFGRLIQGLGDSMISVITGEVVRIFYRNEILSKISTLITAFYVMFIMAPSVNALFSDVQFHIGTWTFSVVNFPSILVGIAWFLCFILTLTYVEDLSLEYDLKADETTYKMHVINDEETPLVNNNFKENFEDCSQKENENIQLPVTVQKPLTLSILFRSKQYLSILFLNCICAYSSIAIFDSTLPVITKTIYLYNTRTSSLLFCIPGGVFVFTLFCIKKLNPTDKQQYLLLLIGIPIYMLAIICIIFSIYFYNVNIIGVASLVTFTLLLGVSWTIEQVILGTILAKIIPSSTQSFAEGIRRALSSFAYIIAGIVTPLTFDWFIEECYILLTLLLLSFFMLIYQRKQFCKLKMISETQ